jgi:excisionase family DNA binding protein
MATTEKLVTPRELAAFMQVSISTIYNWMKDERIPVIRVSRNTVRFSVADVLAALKAGRGTNEKKPKRHAMRSP